MLLLGLLALIMLRAATQLPPFENIQYRNHAVQSHGQDAVRARRELEGCKPENWRARLCPSGKYGLSVVFWCEPVGASLCPGMYTTLGGIEKTSFIRPCDQWKECK